MALSEKQFEELVAEGIDRIPERFLEKLENVAIIVEDEPTRAVLKSVGITAAGETLLGLYEGVSQAHGGRYHRGMPDRITLFRAPIEAEARESGDEIADIVADTVWHEIAHHFGMEEDEVEKAEDRRKGK
jgi:predicted Zn-dependent protease with MMP-like domain